MLQVESHILMHEKNTLFMYVYKYAYIFFDCCILKCCYSLVKLITGNAQDS